MPASASHQLFEVLCQPLLSDVDVRDIRLAKGELERQVSYLHDLFGDLHGRYMNWRVQVESGLKEFDSETREEHLRRLRKCRELFVTLESRVKRFEQASGLRVSRTGDEWWLIRIQIDMILHENWVPPAPSSVLTAESDLTDENAAFFNSLIAAPPVSS